MPTLTITSKGQVTLRKELLEHLGVAPGDKVDVERMSDGRIEVRAARRTRKMSEIFGLLKQENGPRLTIEDINEATARGWAGKRRRLPPTPTCSCARSWTTTPSKA